MPNTYDKEDFAVKRLSRHLHIPSSINDDWCMTDASLLQIMDSVVQTLMKRAQGGVLR